MPEYKLDIYEYRKIRFVSDQIPIEKRDSGKKCILQLASISTVGCIFCVLCSVFMSSIALFFDCHSKCLHVKLMLHFTECYWVRIKTERKALIVIAFVKFLCGFIWVQHMWAVSLSCSFTHTHHTRPSDTNHVEYEVQTFT